MAEKTPPVKYPSTAAIQPEDARQQHQELVIAADSANPGTQLEAMYDENGFIFAFAGNGGSNDNANSESHINDTDQISNAANAAATGERDAIARASKASAAATQAARYAAVSDEAGAAETEAAGANHYWR